MFVILLENIHRKEDKSLQ